MRKIILTLSCFVFLSSSVLLAQTISDVTLTEPINGAELTDYPVVLKWEMPTGDFNRIGVYIMDTEPEGDIFNPENHLQNLIIEFGSMFGLTDSWTVGVGLFGPSPILPVPGSTYYWQIAAYRMGGMFGNVFEEYGKSEVWSYQMADVLPSGVELVYPGGEGAKLDISITPKFEWIKAKEEDNVTAYKIYLSHRANPGLYEEDLVKIINDVNVVEWDTATEQDFALKNGTLYHWQMRTVNSVGSGISEYFSFTTEHLPPSTPKNLYPEDGVIEITVRPELKWDKSETTDSITHYELTISPAVGEQTLFEITTPWFEPSWYPHWVPDDDLEYDTEYTWSVVAVSQNVGKSEPTTEHRFTTISLTMSRVTLLTPENNATYIPIKVEFTWKKPTGILEGYMIYIATTPNPAESEQPENLIYEKIEDAETLTFSIDLSYETKYYWQVVAYNSDEVGIPSENWSFTTTTPAPKVNWGNISVTEVEKQVKIDFRTTNEANLAGFYVKRGTTNTLANATRVNTTIITATNSMIGSEQTYYDTTTLSPDNYYYWIEALGTNGVSLHSEMQTINIVSTVDEVTQTITTLKGNSPNPFNPITAIAFDLEKPTNVKIEIFNIKGQIVKVLVDDQLNAGSHSVIWNGTDQDGVYVGSGVYLYRMITPNETQTKKMLLLK